MSDISDRSSFKQLQTQNQILRAQKEEAQEREVSLRRQLMIIQQLHTEEPHNRGPSLHQDNDHLRQELVSILNQKQQLEIVNRTYLQKINDLKYHNGQLKHLNQKMTQLHSRQIEMIKRENACPERVKDGDEKDKDKGLVRQNQKLHIENQRIGRQLKEVAQVAEEMESYYMGEIRKKNEVIKTQEQQLMRVVQDLEGSKTQRMQHNQYIDQQWQRKLNEIQMRHQEQVTELRGKIKFLINKIQNQQETSSKPSLGALSSISTEMIQSKMVQSSTSSQSFRMTPASLTAKENLTRRNTSGTKTPSKYTMTHRNKYPLADRNF